MNEEEKKAIIQLKILTGLEEFNKLSYIDNQSIKTVLNLVDKQQKAIEELKENQIWSEATIEGLKNDFISKDKIRTFIKEELPDDEIMETCQNYDTNGILMREKLEKLLED